MTNLRIHGLLLLTILLGCDAATQQNVDPAVTVALETGVGGSGVGGSDGASNAG